MEIYGVTEVQSKPSLMKSMDITKIVDKRANVTLGYFIPSKYEKLIKPLIEEIERESEIEKLKRLKKHQDLEFVELGVDDGIE